MAEPILFDTPSTTKRAKQGDNAKVFLSCPKCGRISRGGGYYRHIKSCGVQFEKKTTKTVRKGACKQCGDQTCLERITLCWPCELKKRESPVSKERKTDRFCKNCGKKLGPWFDSYCSLACRPTKRYVWTEDDVEYVRQHYPDDGADAVSTHLGRKLGAVRCMANKIGVHITLETKRRLVHNAAKKYMTLHNPVKDEKLALQRRDWQGAHPSKLEVKLRSILTEIGIVFRPSYTIRPGFIVDVFIEPNLVVEADGEWWHGHPKHEPLRPYQLATRKRDKARDDYLKSQGYNVARIWEFGMSRAAVEAVLAHFKISYIAKSEHSDRREAEPVALRQTA